MAPPEEKVYQHTTIGIALADVLESLLHEGKITEDEGTKIFEEFNHSVEFILQKGVHPDAPTATLRAHVEHYNNYIDRWNLVIQDCEVVLGGYTMPCPAVELRLVEKQKLMKKGTEGGK